MNISALNRSNIIEQITWMNACKAGTLLLAVHMLHVGLWAYFSPKGLCEAFGMRFDGRPFSSALPSIYSNDEKTNGSKAASERRIESTQTENFWPLLFAPREVGFALLLLVLAGLGDWKAVGVVVAIVAGILATTDGVAAGRYGKGGWSEAFKSHGVPAIVLGGMAIVLLAD